MKDFIFASGNLHKVHLLEKFLNQKIEHHKVDLHEIQSLDLEEVISHKAKDAFRVLQKTVLVDDVSLSFHALNGLPGPFIRFFLEELGRQGLCKMLDGYTDRSSTATVTFGLYDGKNLEIFSGTAEGSISTEPRGDIGTAAGMGWNSIFIPKGQSKTFAEMNDEELFKYSPRNKVVQQLKQFLEVSKNENIQAQ